MPDDKTSEAVHQVLREASVACAVLAARLRDAFAPLNSPIPPPQVVLGMDGQQRLLDEIQKQHDTDFKKEATSALRTAQRIFTKLRLKYWLLNAVNAVPYLIAVLLALSLMRAPSFDTTTAGGAAVLSLVALGAVIKRYVSATLGKLVDKRIDELVATALDSIRHSFVIIEATLAAHEGLRLYFDALGPALREQQAQALNVNDA